MLPQAGDRVNINRSKVMWACVILHLATSSPPDSPVCLLSLAAALQLMPREDVGRLGLWATADGAVTLNQKCQLLLCCISMLPSSGAH